jgi:GNAT superfamily N-acetyltransferase
MSSFPIVRTASLAERQSLNDIQVRVSLMWPDYRRRLLDDPHWIGVDEQRINEGRVLVVEARGEAAGFLTVHPREDGDAEIHLFVDPSHWGSDMPRLLVEAAADLAREDGADHLWVVTTEAAVAFYESFDFERAGQEQTKHGPHICLLRPLGDTIGNA